MAFIVNIPEVETSIKGKTLRIHQPDRNGQCRVDIIDSDAGNDSCTIRVVAADLAQAAKLLL